MFEYRRKMQRVVDDLTRLRAVRDGYNSSLNMKGLTNDLSRIDLLTGPTCQSDVQSVRKYVVGFRSDLSTLKCNDIELLHNEIAELSAQIFKRCDQQLLDSHSFSFPSSFRTTTSTPSRTSTLTLKLPTFQGSILNWKDFWALFSSRLEKEPGLTDADKSYLLLEAMVKPKAKERAQAALAHTSTFKEAVDSLRQYYEDK